MIMIIRFCSVCAVPLPLRAADSFLNRDVVSYMAVGIDLNYFFSWPLVLFIFFATRLSRYCRYKVSKLNAIQHGFLPREGYGM